MRVVSSAKYVPKHRAPSVTARTARTRVVRTTVALSGAAVVATGVAVAGGVVSGSPAVTEASAGLGAASGDEQSAQQGDQGAGQQPEQQPEQQADPAQREQRAEQAVSRSDRRRAADPAKVAALSRTSGLATTRTESLDDADPREIGRVLLSEYGFPDSEFSCLDALYVSESDWRVDADNPISSAYGIPQALTETHDLPADYMTSAETQIRWGLEYIANRYGTPCNAWGFKQGNGWY